MAAGGDRFSLVPPGAGGLGWGRGVEDSADRYYYEEVQQLRLTSSLLDLGSSTWHVPWLQQQ